jgi:hypothetical protein
LGIDLEKIKLKFMSIMTQRGIKENADYDDLAGPLLVCVIFGVLLLFVWLKFFNFYRKEKYNSDIFTGLASLVVLESTSLSI